MADTWRITSSDRQAVEGSADSYTLKNLGPDTVYYGGPSVSSSSNDGSIAAGSSVTVAPTKWLISAGQSRLVVQPVQPITAVIAVTQAQYNALSPSPNTLYVING